MSRVRSTSACIPLAPLEACARACANRWQLSYACFNGLAAILALLLLSRLPGAPADHAAKDQWFSAPVGCGNASTSVQNYCPRFFRNQAGQWLPFDISRPGYKIDPVGPSRIQLDQEEQHWLNEPQHRPCISAPNTCRRQDADTVIKCTDGQTKQMMFMDSNFLELGRWSQMIPGSPAVCGHGNREFSFFVRPSDPAGVRTKVSLEKLMLVFSAGGICWDAEGCGTSNKRRMGSGNNNWAPPNHRHPEIPNKMLEYVWVPQDDESKPGLLNIDSYPDYDIVLIPDCTGDMTIGNRSYTYDAGRDTCITAHHMGGINTGMALDWVVHERNSKDLREILIVNTGYNELGQETAFGGHGPVFWASYLQKMKPDVKIRVVTEQNFGIHGPMWTKIMEMDPWGTGQLFEPSTLKPLLPPKDRWSLAHDDMTSYYDYVTETSPTLAFADVGSMHDPSQVKFFTEFGGKSRECCMDGCSCHPPGDGDESIVAGHRDWLKSVKVAVLQRHQRLGQNYRSWLSQAPVRYFLLSTFPELEQHLTQIKATQWIHESSKISRICPRVSIAKGSMTWTSGALPGGNCLFLDDHEAPVLSSGKKMNSPSILDQFIRLFGESDIELDGFGRIKFENLPGRGYVERVFGNFTCLGCLDGVPGGSRQDDEKCNATFARGETLYSIAPRYNSDWMLLWSLNGGISPDTVSKIGETYRFAHEYVMQEGESLDSVALMFATTPDAIMQLNFNRITHFRNPATLAPGDIICVLPNLIDVRDRHGKYICPDNPKHVGEAYDLLSMGTSKKTGIHES